MGQAEMSSIYGALAGGLMSGSIAAFRYWGWPFLLKLRRNHAAKTKLERFNQGLPISGGKFIPGTSNLGVGTGTNPYAKQPPRRRLGLAEMRARKESESFKPLEHQAQVTQNNIAAMEGK